MDVFALVGSKGGAARTTSSSLLALGLHELGLKPLHIQVVMSGCPPVLELARDVPFTKTWIPAHACTAAAIAIRRHAAGFPQCAPVIVDLPAERIRADLVADPDTRILLPMRDGSLEIEWAASDYCDAEEALAWEIQQGRISDASRPPAWFLPVGWPASLKAGDFAAILGRFGVVVDEQRPFPIILPGALRLERLDIMDFPGGEQFFTRLEIQDVAQTLAHAVLAGTRSPLLDAISPDESEDTA
ncbi:hypothetical protein [Microvirga massiliensis]|uniref:hypothetical protein n=1 Tax=Microvirga massiliensis TaxID=1033741 RepID=UPI00062B52E4|nr:hypothetical protein [Microvirga massiliensis]